LGKSEINKIFRELHGSSVYFETMIVNLKPKKRIAALEKYLMDASQNFRVFVLKRVLIWDFLSLTSLDMESNNMYYWY